jgi:hypothetical protein
MLRTNGFLWWKQCKVISVEGICGHWQKTMTRSCPKTLKVPLKNYTITHLFIREFDFNSLSVLQFFTIRQKLWYIFHTHGV